jgi:hypothetical protein
MDGEPMNNKRSNDVAIGWLGSTKQSIGEFFGNYLVITLIAISVFFIIIGGLLVYFVPAFPYIHVVFGVSSSILGAGIFAAVMKGRQFTNIFKKHIYDVVYQPESAFGGDQLRSKWTMITDAILRSSLPRSHQNASDMIKRFYLDQDEELSYHFVDMEKEYTIVVRPESSIADATIVTKSRAVISPNQVNPVLEQNIRVEGNTELESVFVNKQKLQDLEGVLEIDTNDPNSQIFRLPLHDHIMVDDVSGDQYVDFERTIVMTQDLAKESHYLSTFVRYAKGCQIKAKISDGYILVFRLTGGDGNSKVRRHVKGIDDLGGYVRWEVSASDQLNLPGQGYIIIAIPTSKERRSAMLLGEETI